MRIAWSLVLSLTLTGTSSDVAGDLTGEGIQFPSDPRTRFAGVGHQASATPFLTDKLEAVRWALR